MSRGESGSASVEFAVALPLLLFMLFAVVQLSLAINARIIFEHAAYEAARTGGVKEDPSAAGARARRVLKVVPRGPGFLIAEPKVRINRRGGNVSVEIKGKLALLPFFRQVSLAFRGGGVFVLVARSTGKAEPYLGY